MKHPGKPMKMTMTEAEALGRIKMGVNVDIKRSDGKRFNINPHFSSLKINLGKPLSYSTPFRVIS